MKTFEKPVEALTKKANACKVLVGLAGMLAFLCFGQTSQAGTPYYEQCYTESAYWIGYAQTIYPYCGTSSACITYYYNKYVLGVAYPYYYYYMAGHYADFYVAPKDNVNGGGNGGAIEDNNGVKYYNYYAKYGDYYWNHY